MRPMFSSKGAYFKSYDTLGLQFATVFIFAIIASYCYLFVVAYVSRLPRSN